MMRRGWIIAGALILAAVPSVPWAATGVSLVLERVDIADGTGKWIRTGDMQRFKVRLNGMGEGAQVAVAADPAEALAEVACAPPADLAADLTGDAPAGAQVPAGAHIPVEAKAPTGAQVSARTPTPIPTGAWVERAGYAAGAESDPTGVDSSATEAVAGAGSLEVVTEAERAGVVAAGALAERALAAADAPLAAGAVPPGAQVCRLGEVSGERAVDVTLTAPSGAEEMVLAAVVRMRPLSGGETTTMTETAALPIHRNGPAATDSADPTAPPTSVLPDRATAGSAGSPGTVSSGAAGAPDRASPATTRRPDAAVSGTAGSPDVARPGGAGAGTTRGGTSAGGAGQTGARPPVAGQPAAGGVRAPVVEAPQRARVLAHARRPGAAAPGKVAGAAGAGTAQQGATGLQGATGPAGRTGTQAAAGSRPIVVSGQPGAADGQPGAVAGRPGTKGQPNAAGAGTKGQPNAGAAGAAAAKPEAAGPGAGVGQPGLIGGLEHQPGVPGQASSGQAGVPGQAAVPGQAGVLGQAGSGEAGVPGQAGAGQGGSGLVGAGGALASGLAAFQDDGGAVEPPLPWELVASAQPVRAGKAANAVEGASGLFMTAAGIAVLMGTLWIIVTVQRGRNRRKLA